MNNKGQKFLVRIGMLALVAFLTLPLTAFAQDNGRGRGRDRNRDNDSWQREQAERARVEAARRQEEIRRQAELDREAAELRRHQERNRNNNDWHRNNDNYGRNAQYERNRRGRNWDRYGGYGGSFQLRQTALNAGYNNGMQEGRKDRSRGDRFDYRDEGDFQKATEDYSSRLGDRELYKRYFREGFANGYEDGYRGY